MNFSKKSLKLYAITDRRWLKPGISLGSQVELALKGGITMLQLREKNLDFDTFYEEALDIKKLCDKYNVPFIINDNVELAAKVGVDGVHVGQNDMSIIESRKLLGDDAIIGATAKTIEQATAAYSNGATYLGSGAVFGTTTKADAKPMELSLLKEITQSVPIPVVAIGGITSENIRHLTGSGICGVAVVSGIFAQPDITKACQLLSEEADKII